MSEPYFLVSEEGCVKFLGEMLDKYGNDDFPRPGKSEDGTLIELSRRALQRFKQERIDRAKLAEEAANQEETEDEE